MQVRCFTGHVFHKSFLEFCLKAICAQRAWQPDVQKGVGKHPLGPSKGRRNPFGHDLNGTVIELHSVSCSADDEDDDDDDDHH